MSFNFGEVLTRAWQIIWKHRVLWIFGILASCGRGGGGGNGGGDDEADGGIRCSFQQARKRVNRWAGGIAHRTEPGERVIVGVNEFVVEGETLEIPLLRITEEAEARQRGVDVTCETCPHYLLFTGEDVMRFHELVRRVPVAEEMVRYAVQLAASSRPHQSNTHDFVNEWVSWGAGTRAGQFLSLGAKARALLRGRAHVTMDDIQALAAPALRHRILLNYRAEAEGLRVDDVVRRLLGAVKTPVKNAA